MSKRNAGRLAALLLASRLLGGVACAQTAPPPQPAPTWTPTLALKLNVSSLLSRGYQLSAEKVLGPAHRHALMVTPQLYSGRITSFTSRPSESNQDRVLGGGVAVQHRLYLDERRQPLQGLYIGSSVQYQYFRLEYEAEGWAAETDPTTGLPFYQFGLRQQQTTINRYGAALGLGAQYFLTGTPAFVDVYLGFGYRYVQRRASDDFTGQYRKNSLDYGHSGAYTPLAIRFGVAL